VYREDENIGFEMYALTGLMTPNEQPSPCVSQVACVKPFLRWRNSSLSPITLRAFLFSSRCQREREREEGRRKTSAKGNTPSQKEVMHERESEGEYGRLFYAFLSLVCSKKNNSNRSSKEGERTT
jgi:hypothetical protein